MPVTKTADMKATGGLVRVVDISPQRRDEMYALMDRYYQNMVQHARSTGLPELVKRYDRMLADAFDSSFMHLHSTSMFLLDAFLEIEELSCLQINNDAIGLPVADMVPYFQKVQKAGRSLLIRGAFSPKEMKLLMDSLESRGLFLNIMVNSMEEIDALRPIVGM